LHGFYCPENTDGTSNLVEWTATDLWTCAWMGRGCQGKYKCNWEPTSNTDCPFYGDATYDNVFFQYFDYTAWYEGVNLPPGVKAKGCAAGWNPRWIASSLNNGYTLGGWSQIMNLMRNIYAKWPSYETTTTTVTVTDATSGAVVSTTDTITHSEPTPDPMNIFESDDQLFMDTETDKDGVWYEDCFAQYYSVNKQFNVDTSNAGYCASQGVGTDDCAYEECVERNMNKLIWTNVWLGCTKVHMLGNLDFSTYADEFM
jgi:hypothetical protein